MKDKRILLAIYSHTVSNILSSNMARQIFSKRSRFQFSHHFLSIPLKHMIQWLVDEEHLDFRLIQITNDDGQPSHVPDIYISII